LFLAEQGATSLSVDGEEAQLAWMGRQHRVTWRMGRRRTAAEEEEWCG
jgi:hypothetical protein